MTETKPCAYCEEAQPLTAFHRSQASRDGYASRCKECARVSALLYRARQNARAKKLRLRLTRAGADKSILRLITVNDAAGLARMERLAAELGLQPEPPSKLDVEREQTIADCLARLRRIHGEGCSIELDLEGLYTVRLPAGARQRVHFEDLTSLAGEGVPSNGEAAHETSSPSSQPINSAKAETIEDQP